MMRIAAVFIVTIVMLVVSAGEAQLSLPSTRAASTTPPAGFPVSLERVPLALPTTRQAIDGCPVRLILVKIPAGMIEMPTTRPGLKSETIQIRSIWFAQTEITWEMFDAWILARDLAIARATGSRPTPPYSPPDQGFGHEGCPAISMTSHAAKRFCEWLSAQTGHKYRLPTEAEWEYACRAGRDAEITDVTELKKIAWYAANSANADGDFTTHPVAEKRPNAWGLYDMLGNAGEWATGYDGQPVLKGGDFGLPAEKIRSRTRLPYDKSWQIRDVHLPKSFWWLSDAPFAGFRIVRED